MTTPALELRGVSLAVGGQTLFRGVDLVVEERDYLAILGPNGCGKTSLLKAALGLLPIEEGELRVFGESPRRARRWLGYVPQHVAFDRSFPIHVLDVVLMGTPRRGLAPGGASAAERERAHALLERVGVAGLARRPIGRLSGGELQRVLIARALAREPRLLLLDEPTASLDERAGRSLWELFAELSERMAVVLVSHDIGAVATQVRSVACITSARELHRHRAQELTPELLASLYGAPVRAVVHEHAAFDGKTAR